MDLVQAQSEIAPRSVRAAINRPLENHFLHIVRQPSPALQHGLAEHALRFMIVEPCEPLKYLQPRHALCASGAVACTIKNLDTLLMMLAARP